MTRRARAPRGRHSRDDLIELARGLVARDGLPALTMTALGEEAGLTTPALYRYFPGGHDELLLEVVRRGASQLSEYLWAGDVEASDPDTLLREEAERKIALMRSFGPTMLRSVYAGMLQADEGLTGDIDSPWKAADEFIRTLVTAGVRRGTFRDDLDIEATVQLWLAIGIGIDIVYAMGRSPLPIESVYEAFRDAMLRHLGVRPGDDPT